MSSLPPKPRLEWPHGGRDRWKVCWDPGPAGWGSRELRRTAHGDHWSTCVVWRICAAIEASEPQMRETCRAASAWPAPRGIAQMCQEGRGAARGDRHGGRARSRHPQEAPGTPRVSSAHPTSKAGIEDASSRCSFSITLARLSRPMLRSSGSDLYSPPCVPPPPRFSRPRSSAARRLV